MLKLRSDRLSFGAHGLITHSDLNDIRLSLAAQTVCRQAVVNGRNAQDVLVLRRDLVERPEIHVDAKALIIGQGEV